MRRIIHSYCYECGWQTKSPDGILGQVTDSQRQNSTILQGGTVVVDQTKITLFRCGLIDALQDLKEFLMMIVCLSSLLTLIDHVMNCPTCHVDVFKRTNLQPDILGNVLSAGNVVVCLIQQCQC